MARVIHDNHRLLRVTFMPALSALPEPSTPIRALVVCARAGHAPDGSADVLAQLNAQAAEITPWVADPDAGNAEAQVQVVLQRLHETAAQLLIAPSPQAADVRQRGLAMVCVEAARRIGRTRPLVMRLVGPLDIARLPRMNATIAGVQGWDAARIDDLLATLYAGLHLEPAPPAAGVDEAPPLISVIVRSMDRPTLAGTLDSIAWQTCRQLEVLVVNALGAAHSPLPDHCHGLPLRTINGGGHALPRAAAANHGLDHARGEWLLFLDDDDLLLPDHLAKLALALREHPDAIAAYGDVVLGRPGPQGWQAQHLFAGEFDALRLRFENYLPIHAVLFRRSAVQAGGARFDETFELFEDWDFWLQLAAQDQFVHAPGTSARYLESSAGGSDVFADSEQARSSRSRLFAKWQQRCSPAEFAALLERLQALHRSAHQLQRELEQSLASAAGLQQLVQAREQEVAGHQQQQQAMQAVLAAREQEIADHQAHQQVLENLLAAREQASSMVVAARDREIADLSAVLSARENEIANALGHAEGLAQILAARDHEITALQQALREHLAQLRALHAEGPLQALRRTMKTSLHGYRQS